MLGSTLFSNLDDLSRLHRTVTNVAVVMGWISALLLILVALITGNQRFFLEAIGPLVAATVFTVQKILGVNNAVIVFATATTTVTITYMLVGDESTLIPAIVSLVLITMLGGLFVERSYVAYIGAGSLWMLLVPALWRLESWASTGATMTVSYLVGSLILLLVRRAAVVTNRRYRQMFELAPVGLMEQDWSEAVKIAGTSAGESREEMRARLERDPEFVDLIVSSVVVMRANEELGAVAGIHRAELDHERRLNDLLAADLDGWIDQVIAVTHNDEGYSTDYSTHRITGEPIHVRVRSMAVERTTDTARRLVAVDDITEQRLAEEAAAELVRAKDQFIASVSHELRTPLTAIVGFTSEIAGQGLADSEREEISRMVHGQATEMSHIVEDLLVAARADAGSITVKPEPFDLGDAVRDVVDQYGEGGITVESVPSAVAFADPVRVRQILRNLVTNAGRYGVPPVTVTVRREWARVVVDVHDRGARLSEEAQQEIFQPYTRAHDERRGVTASVGLGLAVSHQLAELMDGHLDYVYENGSVFRLTLPTGDGDIDSETPVGARTGRN